MFSPSAALRRVLALLVPFVALVPLVAQDVQGDFLVTAAARANPNTSGGLFSVSALAGQVSSLNATGDLAYSFSLAPDPYDDTSWWVGTIAPTSTSSPAIYRVQAVARKIIKTTKLNVALTAADRTVLAVHVLGHQLMFLTSTRLAVVPVTGGSTRRLLKFDATTGVPTDFACDGRNVFIHMQPTQTLLADHIHRIDLEQLAARTVVYRSASITHLITSVTLDASGGILVNEFEAFSGAANLKQITASGQVLRTFKLPFTHGTAGARMDPAGSTIVVSGKRYDALQKKLLTGFITLLNWKVFKSEFGPSPEQYRQLGVRRHLPLSRYGHVCPAGTRWRAAISANGMPRPGNANYQLVLRGLPGAQVILLVGIHGAMPTPFKLSVMGALTCELGVQPIVSLGFALNGAGSLLVPVAIPSGQPSVNIDVQWLIADRAANPGGFVSSQVGSVVVR